MRRPGRASGDRGSALVELAIVLPLLCLLLLATVELGLAWTAHNRTGGSTSQAARTGAAVGARTEADLQILRTLQASLPADQLAALDRVVVFRASDPSGAVPAGCTKAPGSTSDVGAPGCNSYSGATVRAVGIASALSFHGGAGAKDAYWPPATRLDELEDPPDYLGVWVRTAHVGLTGFGFTRVWVTASSVYRIQPDLTG